MAMDAPTAMPTDTQVLTLAQWFSPAYPIGAFSYSHGLEAAVEGGLTGGAALQDWTWDVLEHGSGRADATLLAAAYLANTPIDLREIDAAARAFAPSRERLLETDMQGTAFCQITSAVFDEDLTCLSGLTYPVAVGYAAQCCDLPQTLAAQMYLHAFASNLVGCAQRLMGLGQTEAQTIIRALAPLCIKIAHDTKHGDLATLSSTAFLADIASMRHETQYSRIFRT